MKLFKFFIGGLIILAAIVYLLLPWGALQRSFGTPAWWQKTAYSFGKFQVPMEYKISDYAEGVPGHSTEQGIVTLTSDTNPQVMQLIKVRGVSELPSQAVNVSNDDVPNPFRHEIHHISSDLKVINYLPFWHFLSKDLKPSSKIAVKGINVNKREDYETGEANVIFIRGSFQKIGIFKIMPFPWASISPVYDFSIRQDGVAAILRSKKNNEALLVVARVPYGKSFDETMVKDFISTVSFDKEIYQPTSLAKGQPHSEVKYSFQK